MITQTTAMPATAPPDNSEALETPSSMRLSNNEEGLAVGVTDGLWWEDELSVLAESLELPLPLPELELDSEPAPELEPEDVLEV